MSGAIGVRRRQPIRFVISAGSAGIDVPGRTPVSRPRGVAAGRMYGVLRGAMDAPADGFAVARRWVSVHERAQKGVRLRLRAGRQAVRVGRDRPGQLRLLRAGPGRLGVRGVSIPRVTCDQWVVSPPRAPGQDPARRSPRRQNVATSLAGAPCELLLPGTRQLRSRTAAPGNAHQQRLGRSPRLRPRPGRKRQVRRDHAHPADSPNPPMSGPSRAHRSATSSRSGGTARG
jgi:hypothetical protein